MNAVDWFEIPAANFERACAFYESTLAIKLNTDNYMENMQLAAFPYQHPGVGGAVIKADHLQPSASGTLVYLYTRVGRAP
ncbi:hypothetical protein [Chitinimonas sp.]|uniref:hypothetical protein n=1 Tax=Chitinimonas sp. TaxID=1934313 RepID=UPI0035B2CA1B